MDLIKENSNADRCPYAFRYPVEAWNELPHELTKELVKKKNWTDAFHAGFWVRQREVNSLLEKIKMNEILQKEIEVLREGLTSISIDDYSHLDGGTLKTIIEDARKTLKKADKIRECAAND